MKTHSITRFLITVILIMLSFSIVFAEPKVIKDSERGIGTEDDSGSASEDNSTQRDRSK